MARIKISQKQYESIILHEKENRLNTISEDTILLEEGWKEVVLGVAMMMGVGLTGQNKIIAQDAVKNDATMAQIKSTLEDETKTTELVKLLKEKGMKDPESKLAQNAEKVMDSYNDIAKNDKIKYRVDTKVVTNLQQLKDKLTQGYALKNSEIKTDTVVKQSEILSITDTIDVNLGSDNLFVTGGFTLSQAGNDTIKSIIDGIKSQNGKILSVEIESSTDSEQIPKFKNEEDQTGNIKLANLRTQSVTNLLNSLGVDSEISHKEIPNNGSHIVSTQKFIKVAKDPKATAELRQKTSEFRYVKIKIIATIEAENIKPETISSFIKNYRFELVKVVETSGKSHHIKTNITFKHKQFKCNKHKKGSRGIDKCTTF